MAFGDDEEDEDENISDDDSMSFLPMKLFSADFVVVVLDVCIEVYIARW